MPISRVAATAGVRKKKKPSRHKAQHADLMETADVIDGESMATRRARLTKSKSKRYLYENIGCYGNRTHDRIAKAMSRLRDAKWFSTSIIGVIFLAGILVGIQTYPIDNETTLSVIDTLDTIVLVIFILEIVVKMVAEGNKPHYFFRDAWNNFDFLIVAVGLMPFGGNAVTALRLVRLLRVLKLVRALPKLRILVMGLLKSLSSIAYIGLLLGLLFYLYAVLGVSVFGLNDPVHMGDLHTAVLTLFRCATLEDWTDVMYIAMEGCENYGYDGMEDKCVNNNATPILSVGYFCSFIILSSMMILNLFIGVITSSMQDAKSELSADLENEGGVPETEEAMMIRRLNELYDTMAEVSDEMSQLAELEKERSNTATVQLSRKSLLRNMEVVYKKQAGKGTPTSLGGGSLSGSPTPGGGP